MVSWVVSRYRVAEAMEPVAKCCRRPRNRREVTLAPGKFGVTERHAEQGQG